MFIQGNLFNTLSAVINEGPVAGNDDDDNNNNNNNVYTG